MDPAQQEDEILKAILLRIASSGGPVMVSIPLIG
jgi:hypothetical protein